MPEERLPSGQPQPPAERTVHPASDDPFHALVRAGARDGEVRCYFAALLDAQDLPETQRDDIWHAFLTAGGVHPRVPGDADD